MIRRSQNVYCRQYSGGRFGQQTYHRQTLILLSLLILLSFRCGLVAFLPSHFVELQRDTKDQRQ